MKTTKSPIFNPKSQVSTFNLQSQIFNLKSSISIFNLKSSILILLLLSVLSSSQAFASPKSPFELLWDDGPVKVEAGNNFDLGLTIRAPAGHYLYADETSVEFLSLEGVRITGIRYPESEKYKDPYLGKEVKIYRGDLLVAITGNVPSGFSGGMRELAARVAFRGCSEKLCFRPEEREITFRIDVKSAAAAAGASIGLPESETPVSSLQPKGSGLRAMLKTQDFAEVMDRGLALALLIVFLAGILTSLTPCVWPVIPMVLLYVGVHPHKRFAENFALSSTLIAGLILVYALLGIVAVAFGKNLGFLFQHRIFLAAVVIFFLAMSLAMFGVFDLRVPQKWHHYMHELGGKGFRGAFLAGMGMGLVASPCAGPVIVALLGYVALQRDYLRGFLFLVVYGIGMGLLTVILGACYGELAGKLRGGPWMVWMRRALGIVLLFPAAFYMGTLFHWSGGSLSAPDKPGIEWIADETQALEIARLTNRPVMIEFGARWCPPCEALDRDFFRRADVVKLSHEFVALRVDATFDTKEVRRLIGKYHVIGWPSVIFLDPRGARYEDLTVTNHDENAIEKGMRAAIERGK